MGRREGCSSQRHGASDCSGHEFLQGAPFLQKQPSFPGVLKYAKIMKIADA
jgi:hypothetical protein